MPAINASQPASGFDLLRLGRAPEDFLRYQREDASLILEMTVSRPERPLDCADRYVSSVPDAGVGPVATVNGGILLPRT